MFVKITNGKIDQYPYTVGDLRRDNPKTSFPKQIPETTMAAFGMYPVGYEAAPDYDPLTHRIEHSNAPVLVGSEWKLTKTVVALTAQQIADATAAKAKEMRKKRDGLLADTDWIITKETEQAARDGLGLQIPLVWLDYRQALRDITGHANFPHLAEADWPTKPE
jgi:hypothetical protein